jgi:hypothetical protein
VIALLLPITLSPAGGEDTSDFYSIPVEYNHTSRYRSYI